MAGEGWFSRKGDEAYRISNYDHLPPFDERRFGFRPLDVPVERRRAHGRTGRRGELPVSLRDGRPSRRRLRRHRSRHHRPSTYQGRPDDHLAFLRPPPSGGRFQRHLFKSVVGNWVEFEEVDDELGLIFGYRWSTSDRFGLIRSARLTRDNGSPVRWLRRSTASSTSCRGSAICLPNKRRALWSTRKKDPNRTPPLAWGLFTSKPGSQIGQKPPSRCAPTSSGPWSSAVVVFLDVGQVGSFGKRGRRKRASQRRSPGAYLRPSMGFQDEGPAWWDRSPTSRTPPGTATARPVLDRSDLRPLIQAASRPGRQSSRQHRRGRRFQHTADRMATTDHAVDVLFNNMRGGSSPTTTPTRSPTL